MKKNLREFAEETASESPAPGGGSISAYAGSLGVALSTMVANLSAKKEVGMIDGKSLVTGLYKALFFKKSYFLSLMLTLLRLMESWRLTVCRSLLKNKRLLEQKLYKRQQSTL